MELRQERRFCGYALFLSCLPPNTFVSCFGGSSFSSPSSFFLLRVHCTMFPFFKNPAGNRREGRGVGTGSFGEGMTGWYSEADA